MQCKFNGGFKILLKYNPNPNPNIEFQSTVKPAWIIFCQILEFEGLRQVGHFNVHVHYLSEAWISPEVELQCALA